jgi:WD40 repeat protein
MRESTVEGHGDRVLSLMHGGTLISGSADTAIKVWNTDTWTCEHAVQGPTDSVMDLAMYSNKLISGSID